LTRNLLPVARQAVFFVNAENEKRQGAAKRKTPPPDAAFKRAYNDGPSRTAGFAIGCGVDAALRRRLANSPISRSALGAGLPRPEPPCPSSPTTEPSFLMEA
jgi:hypothetical protein